jgi:hypothetical protein
MTPLHMKLLLFLSVLLPLLPIDNNIISKLFEYTPQIIQDETRYVNMYMYSSHIETSSMLVRIQKLVFIPICFISLSVFSTPYLKKEQSLLFCLGILCVFLKSVCSINIMLSRLSYYFFIPTIFPIYYLIKYYIDNKFYKNSIIIILYISCIYIIKLIIGTAEYSYDFYLFH